MEVESKSEVAQSCLTLSDPMDCSLPGSSVHGSFPGKSSGHKLILSWKSKVNCGTDAHQLWTRLKETTCLHPLEMSQENTFTNGRHENETMNKSWNYPNPVTCCPGTSKKLTCSIKRHVVQVDFNGIRLQTTDSKLSPSMYNIYRRHVSLLWIPHWFLTVAELRIISSFTRMPVLHVDFCKPKRIGVGNKRIMFSDKKKDI